MESYEEFCKTRLAQIKSKVKLEKSSLPAKNGRGSLIRFHGIAILPPLLSPEHRKEIQKLQLKAMSYSETAKGKLDETQTNMQLSEVDNLLNSVQLIEVPAVKEILEDYSFLMFPNMPVNNDPVKEVNSECVKDSNSTTMHKTSHGHNEPQIPDPTVAQMSNDIEEIYTTNLMPDPVPVKMRSDLINERSGISDYHASFSCLDLVARNSTRANGHIKNGPKSDDFHKATAHAVQNFTIHKMTDTTKHKATNSINKQENLCSFGSADSIVILTGDETNSSNSECLHNLTDKTDVSHNSSPDTPALSLQNLLKKSREYRDRQRQSKLLKILQFNIPGKNLSDKENELDATKEGKSTRGKRNDSGKIMLPNTTLKPEPALFSVFLSCSHSFSEHNQTLITHDVNTGKTNIGLPKSQMLPKENKGTKVDEADSKINFKPSKPFKMIRKCDYSKGSPEQLNAGGQVPRCQERGNNLSGSTKSQNKDFVVPKLTLSKSPVLSKKWICPSQKLLVNTPLSVSSEKIEQQQKGESADILGDQPKISRDQTQYITDLEVNQAYLRTDLQTTLASSSEVTRNEQLLNSEAAPLEGNSDSLCIQYTQEDDESTDIVVANLHWNKGHNDLRFPSHENSIPQTVNRAPAAFHANKLQSFVTQKM
ncbi:uncharacterized protein LOC121293861 [Carcharodon carcharias]|uniref:uncharacterized protein LOC121293861 n=1 Tax=Carcharodon carcharias TaxID=13397 RepID=UPI001B7F59E1|nr:uncharacterized protein LOC121293861 [Carcharodon carcharias]